jgi:hypothetical protein
VEDVSFTLAANFAYSGLTANSILGTLVSDLVTACRRSFETLTMIEPRLGLFPEVAAMPCIRDAEPRGNCPNLRLEFFVFDLHN